MATTYKILGQSLPTTTSNATLYTVPASTETIVSTLTATNITANEVTFNLHAVASGDSAGTDNALAYQATIAANTIASFSLGLTLGAADSLVVASSVGTAVTFQAFGSELS